MTSTKFGLDPSKDDDANAKRLTCGLTRTNGGEKLNFF